MNTRLHTRSFVRAGLYTGVTLYVLCLAFYLVIYGGRGAWMIQPFMPGVSATPAGYLLGLVWAGAYGAGTLWLIAVFYNRGLPPAR